MPRPAPWRKPWRQLAVPTEEEQVRTRCPCSSRAAGGILWLLVLIGGSLVAGDLLAGSRRSRQIAVSLAAATQPVTEQPALTPLAPSLPLPPSPSLSPSSLVPPPSPLLVTSLTTSHLLLPPSLPSLPPPSPSPPPSPPSPPPPLYPRSPWPLEPPPPAAPPQRPRPRLPPPCRDEQLPEWCSQRAVIGTGTHGGGCQQRRVKALCAASCGFCPSPPTPPPTPPRPPAYEGGGAGLIAGDGQAVDVAERVNARFQHGGPYNDPSQAGVLVHLIDRFEDWRQGRPWSLCESGCQNGYTHLDHWACSLVSLAKPDLCMRCRSHAALGLKRTLDQQSSTSPPAVR